MKSIREYWNLLSVYLKPQMGQVLGLTLILLTGIGLQLYMPSVLRDFIDMALAGKTYDALLQKAVLFFTLVLVTQFATTLATYVSERVAWTATNLLRVDLADHCLRLDMSFHQKYPPGALIERVVGDVDALSYFFSQFVVRIVANVILIIGVLVMLYREDWRAGLGLTVFVALAIFIMLRVRTIGVPRWVASRQKTAEAFGGLEILITNTGGPTSGSIDALDETVWQKGIDLCLMAHVRLIKSALPHLRKSKSASVLTVTSYSVRQPIPNLLISNSVRAATVGLTKSLALELGRENIRVNSILPGWTETERVTELMTDRAKKNSSTVGEETERQAAESPFGRMGQPEEFANAAVFLVSPAASFITGVMLLVDGGTVKGV